MSIAPSIIVPVYNEEDNVGTLYNEIKNMLSSFGIIYAIIFVDDGSTDNTFNKLNQIYTE